MPVLSCVGVKERALGWKRLHCWQPPKELSRKREAQEEGTAETKAEKLGVDACRAAVLLRLGILFWVLS